jgi:N-methylhydantoinase B
MSGAGLSPVTLEVVRHALYAIAEEMSAIVMRSARSPLLKEAGDLSSALTDAGGRLIAQGRDIPMHMGVMGFTVQEFLKRVAAERLREGDVWFLNLPEVGGNHLPDVKALRPIFAEGRLVAFAINLAHWADIGGAVPGSYVPGATECYQEGLRIAPVRLFSAAGADRETIGLILANLRGREEREGDILAQFAANEVADRRLGELMARHGVETVLACFARVHAESEAQMRAAIRALPDGEWEGEDWLDDDGVQPRRIRIRVRVAIHGDEATFDFGGTDGQAAGPVNTTPFIARSSVYYAMKALVAPEVPPNDGCYRPLRVRVPPGSVLDPDPDRPVVGGNHETSQRVVDAIFKALAPALPDRIAAGGPTTSGLLLFGMRRPDGRWAILYEVHGGGEGATAARDGVAAVRVHMSNVMNTPTEVIEGEYPIRVEEHALRPGSGGDGAHRGGLGFRRAYRILADDVALTTMLERRVVPPWGAFGGADGQPFRVTLNPGPGEREILGKQTLALRRGDLVLVETCGGGGYGPPAARPAQARERDRRDGYL